MTQLEQIDGALDHIKTQLDEILWADGKAQRWSIPTCRSCGTLLRLRTTGCKACRQRHWRSKHKENR